EGRRKRSHVMPWRDIPVGAFVDLDGSPHVVLSDCLRPWSPPLGYGGSRTRPRSGEAHVLTPLVSICAIAGGYELQIGEEHDGIT
ncbi:MAG TPA: hypothetical protein VGN11_05115, partial [Candidatus Baltobacteraceae bacterium]|nr:hypothetical protein [Candidatus Baltobacteraceae bacterium]